MKIPSNSIPILVDMAAKPFKWMANSKWMKGACDKFEITPEKAMAYTTIASIVGKDSIGCYMYVKQSLNNEKIPEEKRSFVAALDLTNGALMIAAQLLMFFTISNKKVQNALFGKMFNRVFGEKARIKYYEHMRTKAENCSKTKEDIFKTFDDVKARTQDTFGFLTSLIASTTIGKRVIVPFIATPLAGWAKDKFIDKEKNKDTQTDISKGKSKESAAKNVSDVKNIDVKKSDSSTNLTDSVKKEPEQEFKGNLLTKHTTKQLSKSNENKTE